MLLGTSCRWRPPGPILGASSGRFLWAMFLVMLLAMLSGVHLWVSGDVLSGAPASFLALPGSAPVYLSSGGDLLVPRWVLPLGASFGRFLWALPLGASFGRFLWAMLLVMCLAMLLAMLLAALLRAFLALLIDAPGDFLLAETSWSQVGQFLWALPLGASSGCFLWAMLLVMLLVVLSAVRLWAFGDVLGGAPVAFLALPGNAPGYLPSGGDLLVPRWVLPLGTYSGHFLWALPLGASSGRFLWALPLGASSGHFLWAMLLVMRLAMLLVMLLAVLLMAFLALPGDAPGDLPAGGDLLVPRGALPLGASSGRCLGAPLGLPGASCRGSWGPSCRRRPPCPTLGAFSGCFLWALPLGASSGQCSW